MKKLLTIVSILICCFLLFACAESTLDTDNSVGEPEGQGGTTPQTPGDPPIAEPPAKESTIDIYVTFSNAGVLEMKQEKVTVVDLNNDEKFTAEEAFRAFHTAKNKEFALSDGYITKIWSIPTGNCMYYINDEMAYSIGAEMAEGDYLNVFIIKDTTGWSDSYTYFTEHAVNATVGEDVILTVKNTEIDENWNSTLVLTSGAKITIDGEEGEYTTDENGNVTLNFESAGRYVVIASNDTMNLVPAVCIVTVK